jgi:hypothetical protein
MPQTNININNSGKPAPRWFRKFKKVWTNTETAVIILLLATGYASESFLMLCIKTASSWVLENLETILANGQEYKDAGDMSGIPTNDRNQIANP